VRPWTQGRATTVREAMEPPKEPLVRRQRPEPMPAAPTAEARPENASAEAAEAVETERTLAERVAALEERASADRRIRGPGWHRMPSFARSVDQLAGDLKLTPAQRTRVEEAVRRGKQRIEDVLRIPDAEGRSPLERRQERRARLTEALESGDKSGLLELGLAPMRERNKPIPGRETTYGDEIDRITQETKDEIASNLNHEQREAFGDTRIDPLLGESGAVAVSFVSTQGPDGGEVEAVAIAGEEKKPGEGGTEEK